jgi:hypothetical protein
MFQEYERLKAEKTAKVEKEKQEQLKKLEKDLGEGKSVPLKGDSSLLSTQPMPSGISFGINLDSDDDDDEEEMKDVEENEEERNEYESFKRFLDKTKEKEQLAKNSDN